MNFLGLGFQMLNHYGQTRAQTVDATENDCGHESCKIIKPFSLFQNAQIVKVSSSEWQLFSRTNPIMVMVVSTFENLGSYHQSGGRGASPLSRVPRALWIFVEYWTFCSKLWLLWTDMFAALHWNIPYYVRFPDIKTMILANIILLLYYWLTYSIFRKNNTFCVICDFL